MIRLPHRWLSLADVRIRLLLARANREIARHFDTKEEVIG